MSLYATGGLHSTDDPKKSAMQTLITACEFYDADWCGILLVDLDENRVNSPMGWQNSSSLYPREPGI